MLNVSQIRLVQTAVRAAGLRGKNFEGRYRLLLNKYKQPNGSAVRSCKQLNNSQLEDLLAICEALGWRCPGKKGNHFRHKVEQSYITGDAASFAQQSAIKHLAGDLGWTDEHLSGFLRRQTDGSRAYLPELSSAQAYGVIEALKAIIGRQMDKSYSNLNQIREDFEDVTDGKKQTCQVG